MGLLGQSFEDPQSAAILALAGNMVRGDFGGGLLGTGEAYGKAKLGNLQMQDIAQQIKLRDLQAQMMQRKQDMIGSLLGDGGSSAAPAQSSAPAIPGYSGGPLGSGTYGMSMPGQAASAPAPAQSASLIQQARALGIPDNAIRADLALNDGKGIAEMIYKRGVPDMQVSNGYAYDKNRLGAGFMPSLTTSQSGQTSMTRIGPDGMPVVSAPQGAVDTYSAYTSAQKQAENRNTPLPLAYVDTGTGRPMGGNIADYLARQQGGQPGPQAPAPQFPQGSAQLRNQGGGTLAPELQAAILEDAAKNGGPAPTVNFKAPAGLSNPVFGFSATPQQGQAAAGPRPLLGTPTGQLQSPAEAEAAKIDATTPGQANAEFLKGRAANAVKYESALNDKVNQGSELNMRLQEQLGALQKFRAGGGAETRAQLAQLAQGIPGIPKSVVDGVAGGDLASMQEFNKLAAQTAMEQLKSSMGGAGRISQYEFKVFQQNNPNLSTDPNAIKKIFDFNTKLFNRDLAEQQAFNDHIGKGGDPAAFPNLWQQQLVKQGVTNPSMKATDAPAPPVPMKGMIRGGYRFKGGNPADPSSWEKQ